MCGVFCCNETEKGKKNEQYFYEEKTDSAASGIYGNAYGTVYAGEFTVQHRRQLFVAKISEQAMTALSLVFPVQNFINAVAIGFGVGINAQISFQLGAKNIKNANIAATHGMLFNIIHGIIFTVICIPFMPVFLGMFTKEQEVISSGVQYSTIAFAFSTVIMISLSFEKIFQAVGRMKLTMISLMIGCISNIILDPLLIFGVGIFPEMGIRGAALATGLGQVFTVIVYLIAYKKCSIPVEISRKYLELNRNLTENCIW